METLSKSQLNEMYNSAHWAYMDVQSCVGNEIYQQVLSRTIDQVRANLARAQGAKIRKGGEVAATDAIQKMQSVIAVYENRIARLAPSPQISQTAQQCACRGCEKTFIRKGGQKYCSVTCREIAAFYRSKPVHVEKRRLRNAYERGLGL